MQQDGIHHVTAIAGSAQRDVDFYRHVVGLRLVKRTVNFDDPASYQLYYGNGTGQPVTILIFFLWGGVSTGKLGTARPSETAFRVNGLAKSYWEDRIQTADAHPDPVVDLDRTASRIGDVSWAMDAPGR